jgi:hypothetical protein
MGAASACVVGDGSRGGAEPLVGLAVWLREVDLDVRACTRPGCAGLAATGMIPAGVWR